MQTPLQLSQSTLPASVTTLLCPEENGRDYLHGSREFHPTWELVYRNIPAVVLGTTSPVRRGAWLLGSKESPAV